MAKVFISYSWDSDSYRQKIADFVKYLRRHGIEVIYDEDIRLGERLPGFMENGIRMSDYVLMCLTPIYKQKADSRLKEDTANGVIYENTIITAEVYSKNNECKFIPVLFQGTWETSMPYWAIGKCGVDLTGENIESGIKKLIKTLKGELSDKHGCLQELVFKQETDVLMGHLEPGLKEYILHKFEDYKTRNISVRTPQLLLMLLTYPEKNIVEIFNGYELDGGSKYGEFLVGFFRDIDEKYKVKGEAYREEDWTAFMRLLGRAQEVLNGEKYGEYITANILCYTILSYREGATINMMREQIGLHYFEQLKMYVLEDRLPSLLI